jgi:parvulin-like peptidyl-prolyl isomerase
MPPEYEVVMAWVAGKKITVEQFMHYIKQDTRLVVKATQAPGRAEILREMILDRLIEEAMRREDLLPKDRAPDAQEYLQAYQQLANRHFPKANIVPSEEELYQYYQQHPEFFGIPAMARIGQIQFRTPENADDQAKTEVKTKAEAALKRLRAGEPFPAVAEELTENPLGKVAKGDLGFLQPDKEEWLQKAVEGLEVGQFSEVLESPVGYEIILLQDKRDAMLAPYANVRENVLGRLRQAAHARMREEYAWELAREVGVTVVRPELMDAIPESIAAQIKPSETDESVESKPAENQPVEGKSSAVKPAQAEVSETKSPESQP